MGVYVFLGVTLSAQAQDGTVVNAEVAEKKSFVNKSKAETLEELIEEDEDLQSFFGRNPTLMQKILESPILQREVFSKLKNAEDLAEKKEVLQKYSEDLKKEERTLAERKKRAFKKPVLRVAAPQRNTPAAAEAASVSSPAVETSEQTAPLAPIAPIAAAPSLQTEQITAALGALGASNAQIQKQIAGAEEALESADRISQFINKVVEVRRQVIEGYFNLLAQEDPVAHQALFTDGELMQRVLDGELTLYETAVELGVNKPEVLEAITQMDARIPLQRQP